MPLPLPFRLFLDQQQTALLRAMLITLPSLLLVRSVVCRSQWVLAVHSVLRASQRELSCCLPFLSCFLYNPKFRQAHCSTFHLLSPWFLAFLILLHEDGGGIFFRNVDLLSTDYKALYILFTYFISICIFLPFLQFILFYKCS
jgi:hypothetical protein